MHRHGGSYVSGGKGKKPSLMHRTKMAVVTTPAAREAEPEPGNGDAKPEAAKKAGK